MPPRVDLWPVEEVVSGILFAIRVSLLAPSNSPLTRLLLRSQEVGQEIGHHLRDPSYLSEVCNAGALFELCVTGSGVARVLVAGGAD